MLVWCLSGITWPSRVSGSESGIGMPPGFRQRRLCAASQQADLYQYQRSEVIVQSFLSHSSHGMFTDDGAIGLEHDRLPPMAAKDLDS